MEYGISNCGGDANRSDLAHPLDPECIEPVGFADEDHAEVANFGIHPIGESLAPRRRLGYRGGCWFGPLTPQLPTNL